MTAKILPGLKMIRMVRVLIVEDEYILARNLKETLESFGYIVLGIIDSGETAIETANKLRPSIILMDIRIRGEIDGIQAARQIWQQLEIPVIYVTGHSDQSTIERAKLTFPFGYILKPIREKELYVAIETALNRYEREQFFSTVLQEMGDGVIVVDPQLHIKYLNSAAEALTGWTLNEVQEENIANVFIFLDEHNHCPIIHPLILALQTEKTIYLVSHVLLVRKDGTELPIADSVALLRDNDRLIIGAVLVFRDDTQRRLMEERDRANELIQQTESRLLEQRRITQLKDDFLATISHELRTPLSNIKLIICLLETFLNQEGILTTEGLAQAEVITKYLSIIQDQCDEEINLVNDLLDLRALESGAYPLDLTTIQIEEWLSHITENFQTKLTTQQQTLQITVSPNLTSFVSDRISLSRIVLELLNNACKYTPIGEKITIEVRVDPVDEAENIKSQIAIIISNSGVEISSAEISRIFEPFYRISKNDFWKQGGSGLGLALVKTMVEYLQGTIQVTSNQNWTIFMVRLPLG